MTSEQNEYLGLSIRGLRWTATGDTRPDLEDPIHEGVHVRLRNFLRAPMASVHDQLREMVREELRRGV